MRLKKRLSRALGAKPSYRCAHCSLSFDREPLNCPACGSQAVVRE